MESMPISEGEDKPPENRGDYRGRGNSPLLFKRVQKVFKRVQKRWRAYRGIGKEQTLSRPNMAIVLRGVLVALTADTKAG